MTDVDTLKKYLQRALAVAHAALDDAEPDRVADARALAAHVLSLTARTRPAAATLADGHELFALTSRLRTVVEALDGVADRMQDIVAAERNAASTARI